MKERINKLARGIVDMISPELKMSKDRFEGTLSAGEISKFDMVLTSENGVQLKGLIYSDNPKVTVLKSAFGGVRTRIFLSVDARGLESRKKLEGKLTVVSNAGELEIPYVFYLKSRARDEEAALDSAADFRRLFEEDEEHAIRVFDTDDFRHAFFMQDSRTRAIYDGLRHGKNKRIAVIEFLKALHEAPELSGHNPEFTDTAVMAQAAAGSLTEDAGEGQNNIKVVADLKNAALVEALADQYIKEERVDREAFRVYSKAISNGSRITRLYEYYLYALPEEYTDPLPREVYLYFAFENSIDDKVKLPLFYNVLLNFSTDTDIYQRFERKIQEYAIDELLHSRINDRLALIYDRMIFAEMVDEHIAEVLPAILYACKIRTEDRRVTSVVVKYQELDKEEVFRLRDGAQYVPLYFDNAMILFQDSFGNRLMDIAYEKTRVMHKPELEERCFTVYPEHPVLKLAYAREIAKNGIKNERELLAIEEAASTAGISPLYRSWLYTVILRYYEGLNGNSKDELNEPDIAFLKTIPSENLTDMDQRALVRALIRTKQYVLAFHDMILHDIRDLDRKYLERLLGYMVLNKTQEDAGVLTLFCMDLFNSGSKNADVLQYLLENYNGSSREMLQVLKRGTQLTLDIASMAERLLAQMLFSRSDEGIDYVYERYSELPKHSELLVRAYVTRKCAEYFIYGKGIEEKFFGKLFRDIHAVNIKDRVPVIHLLALTKHMSLEKSLTPEETMELREIMDVLLRKKLIFAYTKKLSKFITLPDYVTDRYYIEYTGDGKAKPELKVRVLPDDKEFHPQEFTRVYLDTFVCPMVLFSGERAEYEIYLGESKKPVKTGVLEAGEARNNRGDTYDILNDMSDKLSGTNDNELKNAMLRYVRNESVIDELFAGKGSRNA